MYSRLYQLNPPDDDAWVLCYLTKGFFIIMPGYTMTVHSNIPLLKQTFSYPTFCMDGNTALHSCSGILLKTVHQ